MNTPIVDHLWTKISEQDYIGRIAVEQKLEEVHRLSRTISQAQGQEVANNVMKSGLIETALLRCKQFHDGDSRLIIDDLYINYAYATSAMREAQQVIDEELAELGL
ncbi:hypothetical protein ALP73_00922 [Pseudomonas coronafaciens pv. garcae]|uniref:Uncharacterized protein n=1 Tax=Pseudomonas tremae TaxID=200454 RepID=A0ABV4PN28_9PSED|nr:MULTISPECIES: hypothetical protein [Pseudomonas]MCO5364777.1 hypothetical protein [Pseudomonas alliivorans]RMR98405.1 hypothetical protein ALP73_00922 [Pseudomonas coronafaciens pv. garcae]RMS43998.1 hypothetical protein ALP71_01010 [Pseudomonas coronafaciens pv. garcae]